MGRLGTRAALLLHLAVPLALGLLLGANQARIGASLPWHISVMFWVMLTVSCWTFFGIGTVIADRVLSPWSPPPAVTLLAGMVLGSVPARPLIGAMVNSVTPFLIAGRDPHPLAPFALTMDFALNYLEAWSGPAALWVAANLGFQRLLELQRLRLPDPDLQSADTGDASSPTTEGLSASAGAVGAFMARLPPRLGRDVLALRSEDHYVRVYTKSGNALVLCRFQDAVAEVEAAGFGGARVHRSWWVARGAIASTSGDGRVPLLLLGNGLEVPVSQTYKETARLAGILASPQMLAGAS